MEKTPWCGGVCGQGGMRPCNDCPVMCLLDAVGEQTVFVSLTLKRSTGRMAGLYHVPLFLKSVPANCVSQLEFPSLGKLEKNWDFFFFLFLEG